MIDKESTFEPPESGDNCSLTPFDIGKVALTPEKIAAMTTSLDDSPNDPSLADLYRQTKTRPEYLDQSRL